MRRIAFFVEGLTERLFIEKLVSEVFGQKHLIIEIKKMQGGGKSPITIIQTQIAAPDVGTRFYILIYDCGGDSKIRSYIDDQRSSLVRNGYEKIIGVRDVYPETRADIQKLRDGLYYRTPQLPIPTVFVLAVMEIETWFLAEYTHFSRINPMLTTALINANLGFDPSVDNMELRNNPATDLDECYKLVGDRYTKRGVNIQRTVDSLDYSIIYFHIRNQVQSLNSLVNEIDLLF